MAFLITMVLANQVAAVAFDSASRASTDILVGLADQEFEAIRTGRDRLGNLMRMFRQAL